MNGTYLIKAVTAEGVESEIATAIVVTSVSVLNMNAVATIDEAGDGFLGDWEGVSVVNGALRLASQDTLSNWPSLGAVPLLAWGRSGVVSRGTYLFSDVLDLGAVYVSRVAMSVDASAATRGNMLATWATLASVKWLSGAAPGSWRVVVQVRTTDNDPDGAPGWSEWNDLVIGGLHRPGLSVPRGPDHRGRLHHA